MTTLNASYRSLSVLIDLNRDRILSVGVIAVALLIGAYLGSL